jgi:hypothetical protein
MSLGKKLAKSGNRSTKQSRKDMTHSERVIKAHRDGSKIETASKEIAHTIRDKIGKSKSRVITIIGHGKKPIYVIYEK